MRWTVGFSSAQDVWNPALGRDAARVPWRRLYGDLEQLLGPSMVAHVRPSSNLPQLALGDGATVAALGLRDGVGAAASGDGTQVTVVGASLDLPPGLAELSGTLLSPGGPGSESLRSIHVVLEDHRWISEVESGIGFVLGATQAESVDVRSSRELVELRAAIAGDFGAFGRRLTAIILLAAACLVALNVYMAVTGRRRDFGRRRALGASRPMLIALVSLGTGLLALAGAVSGLLVGAWWSWWTSGVWPSPSFVGAVGVLTVVVAVAASLPPAAVAAFRDPVRALRVP